MRKNLEKNTQNLILAALSKLDGGLFWRNNTGQFWTARGVPVKCGVAGSPDIIGCYKGRFYGVEVKTYAGGLSKSQINFKLLFEKSGGIYVVVRSVENLMEFFS